MAPNDVDADADADASVDSGSCCLCADVDAGRDVAVVTLWFVCHFRFAFACRASTKVRQRKKEIARGGDLCRHSRCLFLALLLLIFWLAVLAVVVQFK